MPTVIASIVAVLLMLAPGPRAADARADAEARLGMPFSGRFAGSPLTHPDTHERHFRGNQWSTDLFAAAGTPVAVEVPSHSGKLQLKVEAVGAVDSANGVRCAPAAGTYVKLGVLIDGQRTGQVVYGHLRDVTVSKGEGVADGTVIGTTAQWPQSACWQVTNAAGVHVHVELGSTASTACYVGDLVGAAVPQGQVIGAIGGGHRALRCPQPLPALGEPGAAVTAVTVFADRDWLDTGVELRSGDTLNMRRISGSWTYWHGTVPMHDADGAARPHRYVCTDHIPAAACNEMVPGAAKGALVARVGNGPPFLVGEHRQTRVDRSGALMLRINDGPLAADLADNTGSIQVEVSRRAGG